MRKKTRVRGRGEAIPTKRSTRLFAAANHLFMESALIRETRESERKGEPRGSREKTPRGEDPTSEFLILRNRPRIPERFHSPGWARAYH